MIRRPRRGRNTISAREPFMARRIVRLYCDDLLTAEEIASQVGWSRSHVDRVLHEAQVERRKVRTHKSWWDPYLNGPERIARLELYAQRAADGVCLFTGQLVAELSPEDVCA